MNELAQQVVSKYEQHGWKLRRILTSSKHKLNVLRESFPEAEVVKSEIDALWFSRPSHAGREAWELRLIGEQPYALFEG